MSTTRTLSRAARAYLDEVRSMLSDLPDEDRQDVIGDLESHLAELGDEEVESTMGAATAFVAEFRASAGLSEAPTHRRPRFLRRLAMRVESAFTTGRLRASRLLSTLEPLVAPLEPHLPEIRTAWVWTRGGLAVMAIGWLSVEPWFGSRSAFGPFDAPIANIAVMAVATWMSVRLDRSNEPRMRLLNKALTVGVAVLLVTAMGAVHRIPEPEERGYAWMESSDGTPALLVGPNGPIQNIYAYDTTGQPVSVFLYDEFGNPIRTMPSDAYPAAHETGPFVWGDYEVRLPTDTYGRIITNLYPLQRFEWTGRGARSAPQPPPAVGIPPLPESSTPDKATTETSDAADESADDAVPTSVGAPAGPGE